LHENVFKLLPYKAGSCPYLPGRKGFLGANTLAYYATAAVMKKKNIKQLSRSIKITIGREY
jgi:hypothetical protein